MKSVRSAGTARSGAIEREQQIVEPSVSSSSPGLPALVTGSPRRARDRERRTPRGDGHSASDSNLSARLNDPAVEETLRLDTKPAAGGDERSHITIRHGSAGAQRETYRLQQQGSRTGLNRQDKHKNYNYPIVKKTRSCNAEMALISAMDLESPSMREIRDIHNNMRSSARIIKDSRTRLLELQKKSNLTEIDVKELSDRHDLLLREMERFDRLTRNVQKIVDAEVSARKEKERKGVCRVPNVKEFMSSSFEPALYHEMKMAHPTVVLGHTMPPAPTPRDADSSRSKSEIDLTRRLNESYDMQEKLVADNADLEVKRYILYKELMTKDQNLETCRAQIKRLQGELKLMTKENALLHDRIDKNNPEGDATTINYPKSQKNPHNKQNKTDSIDAQNLVSKLDSYHSSSTDFERQLSGLEVEVHTVKVKMEQIKKAAEQVSREGAGPPSCKQGQTGPNTCFKQPPGGPIVPPMSRACGVCPPCPAPCNPNAPPTPAEREVARLSIQLKQTEENFKQKVTECAMLRSELLKKKEDLEKERCQHREVTNKLRELEMRYEGLQAHTNMMLGTKEQALETEINVRALKRCYREAREEIDELRQLMKEQNNQVQDYRVKYMQAQQLVEEQRRQLDLMDLDNNRISEQINLEIQKVKLKFQEKLQELAPLPDLLKATQMRLKDAQQSQALAEHSAEQLARELNLAREKVHFLLHSAVKPPADKQADKAADEKHVVMLQQRITQLIETQMTLKSEIERLKANIIRMEESVVMNEKRLQEKMHECAQLGGELDRTREEAARAIERTTERGETIRKCLQTTIAELERQLAASRAQVRLREKEREELQCRMSCQIKRLKDNFEQAELRIMGLTSQVQTLRNTTSSIGGDEGIGDTGECTCKTLFENP